jgi:serine/threonine protein kinase
MAWKAGKPPQIEEFVAGQPDPESSHLFRELLKIDVECRIRCGSKAQMSEADYRQRFPDRSREISAVFAISARRPVPSQFASTMSMLPSDVPRQIDKYELLHRIGRGGMGEVYQARHVDLNRTVALKLINAKQMENPQAVARFKREMQAVGLLNHPNIVNATDGGEVEGTHYLVMELVDGIDLAKLVRRLGRLSISDACEIGRQAALGMAHAHEMGLIHRDLKPSNLMLDKHGSIKVLDMGLARLLDPGSNTEEIPTLTSSGQAVGTPEYMAPEQARNTSAIDQRADIYSLGCTLYEFLVGQPPFPKSKHETPVGVLMAQLNDPLPPPELSRSDLPDELVECLRKLLAKNPNDRTPTMVEVASQLESLARSSNLVGLLQRSRTNPLGVKVQVESPEVEPSEPSLPPTPLPPVPAPVVSRRHVLVLIGLVAIALATGAWFLWPESGTDVLASIDPNRDRVRGNWQLDSKRLISSREGVAILRLPTDLPREFDLEAVIGREHGTSLAIVHINPSTPFAVLFETNVQVTSGPVQNVSAQQAAGTVLNSSWPLHRQTPSRLVIEVRKGRLQVRLNDDPPIDWSGSFSLPDGLAPEFDLQREGLYLRTADSEFQFSSIRIVDRTGRS